MQVKCKTKNLYEGNNQVEKHLGLLFKYFESIHYNVALNRDHIVFVHPGKGRQAGAFSGVANIYRGKVYVNVEDGHIIYRWKFKKSNIIGSSIAILVPILGISYIYDFFHLGIVVGLVVCVLIYFYLKLQTIFSIKELSKKLMIGY
ncbi:MAG: hypothetical protein JEZ14_26525 [Marinilabiliaceae bacterium]|nr:hypothetical protein [Marinilabiliaceae bacterium]